jgi:hypothetical protein
MHEDFLVRGLRSSRAYPPIADITAHSWIDDLTEKLTEIIDRLIDDFDSGLWPAFRDEFEYLMSVLFFIETSDEWRIQLQ